MNQSKKKTVKDYVKFYKKFGAVSVYIVDDFLIRNTSLAHEEFSNYALHEDFPDMVPKGQVWISKNESARERKFDIDSALDLLKLFGKGEKYGPAYDKMLRDEKAEREKRDKIKKHPGYLSEHALKEPWKKKTHVSRKVYKKKLGKYQGYNVWIVKQEMVQDLYKTDFVDGGNPSVYHWIPQNELWLSDALDKNERYFVLWHEYIERTLMKEKGWTYDRAHERASKTEYNLRKKAGLTGKTSKHGK
jgi:hypothetical protein